ncbi:unnamed protein product [Didymodactylos carnosus]|uniref:Uncharacterized protein n=1 Tax=Didymodactylos carnosus TaxID=1234261 RepID=A0A815EZB1_9BILA|nr:unnamed protein product [Didymodactylos carnosus]CAF4167564.1 unnamed protein product [Didymodactylos carnosus]
MSNPPRSSMLSQSPDTATHVQYITPQFDPRASYAQSIKNNTWDNSINQGKPQRIQKKIIVWLIQLTTTNKEEEITEKCINYRIKQLEGIPLNIQFGIMLMETDEFAKAQKTF